MSYYEHHVFFCVNKRAEGVECCAHRDADKMRAYAKDRVKSMNLSGKSQVRINSAGCLDRCDQGPVMVVYPQGTWYTYFNESDIDEIIDEHLVNDRVVTRLCLDETPSPAAAAAGGTN